MKEWTTLFSALFEFLKTSFSEMAQTTSGLLTLNPKRFLETVQKIRSGEAFAGSEAKFEEVKQAIIPIAERTRKDGILSAFGPGVQALNEAVRNIRQSGVAVGEIAGANIAGLMNRGPALAATAKPGATGTVTNNRTVQQKNDIRIQLPEGALADQIRSALSEVMGQFLREANLATNPVGG